jgi:hypothetical protein
MLEFTEYDPEADQNEIQELAEATGLEFEQAMLAWEQEYGNSSVADPSRKWTLS